MNEKQTPENPVYLFLRRRWPLLGAAAAAAAVGAVVLAGRFSSSTYAFVGTMLYNRSTVGAPAYLQPEVQSIVGLVKSHAVLAGAVETMTNPPPPAALAAGLQAEVLSGSNTIQLTLRGADAEQTRAALDAVMRQLAVHAGKLRRTTLEQILASQEVHERKAREAAKTAAAALREFNAEHRIVVGVDDDLERVRDDISSVETALETQRAERRDPEETAQRRRALLLEEQNAERERVAREAEHALKKNEFERAARLHGKRYISDAEFRRIETEFRALEEQRGEAFARRQRRVDELTAALSSTDPAALAELMPSLGGDATAGDADAAAALEKRVVEFLGRRRAEAERLNGLRSEGERLKNELTSAQAEVARTVTQRATYEELRDSAYHDLAVVQPAAPGPTPESSNAKKLGAGIGLGLFFALATPLLVFDLIVRRPREPRQAPLAARLPQINPPSDGGSASSEDVVRTLALRIQQTAREHGSIALLSDVDSDAPSGGGSVALAAETARCLTHRGETVLIVELSADAARRAALESRFRPLPAVDETAAVEGDWTGRRAGVVATRRSGGLAELLLDRDLAADAVVRRGASFDLLTAGERSPPPEAFAGRRLSELLNELGRRYSTILLLGPGIEHAIDLEMLAARTTSIVFVAAKAGRASPAARRTVDALYEVNAPVLGLVTV